LPEERDNASNNARCMQARKTTHSLNLGKPGTPVSLIKNKVSFVLYVTVTKIL